jgi:ERF superfamily protein
VLSENGLAISQLLTTDLGGAAALRTVLLHESGESLESIFPFPVYGNLDAQGWGSVITYFRRYALTALLGIATEEDDDGNSASGNHVASANEVRARQDSGAASSPQGHAPAPPTAAPENPAAVAQAAQEANRTVPTDDGKPENVVLTFGKHKDSTLGQVPDGYLKWLIENYEPKTAEQRRLIAAAHMLLRPGPDDNVGPLPDDDIPF